MIIHYQISSSFLMIFHISDSSVSVWRSISILRLDAWSLSLRRRWKLKVHSHSIQNIMQSARTRIVDSERLTCIRERYSNTKWTSERAFTINRVVVCVSSNHLSIFIIEFIDIAEVIITTNHAMNINPVIVFPVTSVLNPALINNFGSFEDSLPNTLPTPSKPASSAPGFLSLP